MRFRRTLTLLAAGASLLLATACGGGPAGAAAGAGGEPHAGGELTHLLASVSSNNWQMPSATNWHQQQVINQIIEPLVFLDTSGGLHPGLAESWTKNDAGTEYTIVLKQGVTFSDGTPLDAAIVIRNLDVIARGDKDKGRARVAAFTTQYDHAEAVDAHTVKVVLTAPDSGFVAQLGHHSTAILGAHTLDGSAEDQAKLENLVGTGPFVYESQVPEREITLTRREDYDWGSSAYSHTGPAYLEKIHFIVTPEDGVRIGTLESGQADSIYSITPVEETRLGEEGYTVVNPGFQSSAHGLAFRLSAPHVDDVRVRQAVQRGIDRQEIISTLFNANWAPGTSVVGAELPGHVDLSSDLSYQPDLSNRLLDEAGWTGRDARGIRTKDGVALELSTYSTPYLTYSQKELQLVAQQLARIGVQLDIKIADASSYAEKIKDPTLSFVENTGTLVDISSQRQWESSAFGNRYATVDPTLDGLLDSIVAEQDTTTRNTLAAEYQRLVVADEAYYVPLEDDRQVYVTAPDVRGTFLSGPGRVIFYDTWLDR